MKRFILWLTLAGFMATIPAWGQVAPPAKKKTTPAKPAIHAVRAKAATPATPAVPAKKSVIVAKKPLAKKHLGKAVRHHRAHRAHRLHRRAHRRAMINKKAAAPAAQAPAGMGAPAPGK